MKRLFFVFFLMFSVLSAQAYDSFVKVGENVRFSVLTPSLIRMEWSENGRFEDRASLTFINRNMPVPEYKVSRTGKKVVIKTSELTLTYRITSGEFTRDNLKVEFLTAGRKTVWTPGADPSGNLMGTCRTLDRVDGNKHSEKDPLEKGLLSRDGWSLVDDSNNYLFDESGWVIPREKGNHQDWYLFAYGHRYREALADFSKVAGSAPMPPRYVFGYWWSRYWQYSDSELRDVISRLRSVDIPVDVLIIDMDWHETWGLEARSKVRDEYGQRPGWTGYTWQKNLFPNPSNMFSWAHRARLHTALNLHPASGIKPEEEPYEAFCKEYGWDKPGESVPFHIDEKKWSDAYYKTVLKPIEEQGNTFWWLDWQQWKESKYNPGLSNTFWLNHVFFSYAAENHPDRRPFLYHRWGGLGSHRYPLGFSGDTYISWASLEYQPEFTATSANVNYGYWGHDLGGHFFPEHKGETDPELYTRWLQYGVFSPLYKIHPTKHPALKRFPWLFPDHMFIMVDAFHLRYALVPYIYNASRKNYDTGVAMCHPLYYDYPEAPQAYDNRREFMFGDDILATSIGAPADKVTGLAPLKMWFPEGSDWFDMSTGAMYKGGSTEELSYTIEENPWFVKAGSIIPMNPAHVRSLSTACDTLVLTAVPGGNGELNYYEDDGISRNYKNEYAITRVCQQRGESSVVLTVYPGKGNYEGMNDTRSLELRFPATRTPLKVEVNGQEIPYDRFAQSGQWTYDAYRLSPVVYLKDVSVKEKLEVRLTLPEGRNDSELYGLQGLFLRCRALSEPYKVVSGYVDRMKMLPDEYLRISQCPNFIMEDPVNIFNYVDDLNSCKVKYNQFLDADPEFMTDEFKARLKAQLQIL